jgi:hypothetical protein
MSFPATVSQIEMPITRLFGKMVKYDSSDIKIEVVAYSGYKANERPIYFVLGEERLEVKEILERWYGQDHDYFKVVAGDGLVCLLKWHRFLDIWFLVSGTDR